MRYLTKLGFNLAVISAEVLVIRSISDINEIKDFDLAYQELVIEKEKSPF